MGNWKKDKDLCSRHLQYKSPHSTFYYIGTTSTFYYIGTTHKVIKLFRACLEHRNSTGNSQDRIVAGKNSFEPFGTQE
jgi:hypothetical protein